MIIKKKANAKEYFEYIHVSMPTAKKVRGNNKNEPNGISLLNFSQLKKHQNERPPPWLNIQTKKCKIVSKKDQS